MEKQDCLKCCLVEFCSPTLASLKTANLFWLTIKDEDDFQKQLKECHEILEEKGLFTMIMSKRPHKALIYVCRRSALQKDLQQPGVKDFLSGYGYQSIDVDETLEILQQKLKNDPQFPHEIGIFLGYPLGDVIGFIENAGQNSLCSGCWKVYCNECEAMKKFNRFKKCTQVYKRLWSQGRSLAKLTVAA